ncbi:uncharacterized protein TNCV_3229061 [Trichonephila clavipes]|nr:uncharacterized protein TNCV_3229061 [Trichonephila clavipes]
MLPSWSHKLKRDSSEKTTWCQSACQALCSSAIFRCSHRLSAMRGILYKGILTHNPWCSRHRRINEAGISASVAVDQRAVNCPEDVIRPFTVMRSRCRSSRTDVTFLHPLPVFRVVLCSSIHCFQTRITVELFRCS